MSFKLVEHKVIDHEPLPLPPSCLGGVHHQVATDLRILVTCLHLWGRGEEEEKKKEGEEEEKEEKKGKEEKEEKKGKEEEKEEKKGKEEEKKEKEGDGRGRKMEMEGGGGIRRRQKKGKRGREEKGKGKKERMADRKQNFVCLLATEDVMSCKVDRRLCPYLPEDRRHVDLLLTTHHP